MPGWGDVLQEIQLLQIQGRSDAFDVVRRKYLADLSRLTGRNTIAYYSGFLSKPGVQGSEITDEDKNGFMAVVQGMDRAQGLDLLLHTPGGETAATQSIVDYLRRMFGTNIRAVVPQIAMSAGTIVACSCREMLMGSQSNIGPIDPQLRGIPAYGVLEEFKRAFAEIKSDPTRAQIWQVIIAQYRPTFLGQCDNAIKWSNAFVRQQLAAVMFAGDPDALAKAREVVRRLTDYRGNRTHDRHINIDECLAMGLKVVRLEDDQALQDLVLTVHHCYMHTLGNTGAVKIIENQKGVAAMKLLQMQVHGAVP